jgi:hypothetical protein
MATDARAQTVPDPGPSVTWVYRLAGVGAGTAAVAAALGFASRYTATLSVTAGVLGVLGMIVAGFTVSRRPRDSAVLAAAALTAGLAGFATHPDWDSVRLMQWVMAGVAGVAAVVVLLPRTAQRVVVSLLVLFHFAGILSAITSPPPTPWLTAQLWARVFRPHLEFCYVNNAYQFYSPQPGPAQVLWFCITGADDQVRWFKMPRRSEMLDPLAVEYFRRLSLTERANQNVPTPLGPPPEVQQLRLTAVNEIPFQSELMPARQYRPPNEHARQILAGYARHVANVIGSGRPGVPVQNVKIYLTQHRMLSQKEFADGKDPYDKDTYWPFFVGEFDPDGRLLNPYDPLLYWIVPIVKQPDGSLKNYVAVHAKQRPDSPDCDPFDPKLEWRVEK